MRFPALLMVAPAIRVRQVHALLAGRVDEIAARQLHALKQHYEGKLRLSGVKQMFEQMRDLA
jgi:hypothetical protein